MVSWFVLNLDKRQYFLPTAGKIPLSHLITRKWASSLVDYLSKPEIPDPVCAETSFCSALLASRSRTSKRPGLLQLPVEVISMVFAEVDNVQDAACLCLTSRLLSIIGQRHCYNLLVNVTGSWVGDSIICLDGDLPAKTYAVFCRLAHLGPHFNQERTLDFVSRTCHRICHNTHRPSFDWRFTRRLSHWEEDMFWKLASPKHCGERGTTAGNTRVLCNLTKGQYVREELLQVLTAEQPVGLGSLGYNTGLVQAMLCRVWCAEFVHSNGPVSAIWASDCFEITQIDRLRGGRTWVDVSWEVIRELKHVGDDELTCTTSVKG